MTDATPYLSQTEAARLLRLSPKTLERFRLEGRGPVFMKFGRRVMYALADLHAWAAQQRRTSTSDSGHGAGSPPAPRA